MKKQDGPEQTEEKERGYMKKVQIRQASIGDLDAVTGIEADCFAPAEAADRESLKARLGKFPGSFLVAECGGEIAGFINGAVTDERTIEDEMFENVSLHDPNGAYQSIFGLDVIPGFRHQGVAGQLMKAMIQQAEQEGRKGLILTCKEHLIGFYERFGYKNMGVSRSVHGGAVWYDMILEF